MSDSKKALEDALKQAQNAKLEIMQNRNNFTPVNLVNDNSDELEVAPFDMQTTETYLGTNNKGEPIYQITDEPVITPKKAPEAEQANNPSVTGIKNGQINDTKNVIQPEAGANNQAPSPDQVSQKPIQPMPRARRPDMQMTKDEQDMLRELVADPKRKQIADKIDEFKLKHDHILSDEQKNGITELFKLLPENPKPTPAEKKDLKEKSDEIMKEYDLDELTDEQQKELNDILTITPALPKIRINPNLPKPEFSDEQQKKFDQFMEDKGFENKAPEVKQLYAQAFQAVLISELLNRNDAVDKDLEVQFQDAEKLLYGVDTPVETLQVGVTDNTMELLDRLCATDGFETLEEKTEQAIQNAKEKAENKKDAMLDAADDLVGDAAIEKRQTEEREEIDNSIGMRFGKF